MKRARSDSDLEQSEKQHLAKKQAHSARPKGSKDVSNSPKAGGGRPRGAVEPSAEFKALLAKGTAAFLERAFDTALEYAKQAVQINPEIFAAHSLISQIYYEIGLKEESLGVLWSGAHAQREPGVWWEIAGRLNEMDEQDRQKTLEKLLYCYSAIIRLNPKDFDARKAKLDIYMEREQTGQSIRECTAMIKLHPQDLETLQLLADLCLSVGEPKNAIDAYRQSISYYQRVQPDAQSGRFSFSDLNIFLEIFVHTKQWQEGLRILRSLSRWLCGRRNESFWDRFTYDDREWDIEHQPRRISVPEFSIDATNVELYGLGLPPEIRAKLGIFRLNIAPESFQEAMRHFDFFDPQNPKSNVTVRDYPDIFLEIADCLFQKSHYLEALKFYEALADIQHIDSSTRERMGYSYFATSNLDLAIEFYELVFEEFPTNSDICITLAKIYSAKCDDSQVSRYIRLAKGLGRINAVKEANIRFRGNDDVLRTEMNCVEEGPNLPHISTVLSGFPVDIIRKSKHPRQVRRTCRSTFKGKHESKKLSEPSLRLYYELSQRSLPAIQESSKEILDEWCQKCNFLLQKFRSYKPLSTSNYHQSFNEDSRDVVAPSKSYNKLEYHLKVNNSKRKGEPTYKALVYLGLYLSEWLDLICQYAIVKAISNDSVSAYSTLEIATTVEAFSNDLHTMAYIQLCTFACAWVLSDEEKICTVARWFMKNYNFKTDTFRLYAAFNRLFPGEPSWYNSGPSQKFIMRQVKFLDFTLLDNEARNSFTFSEQEHYSWRGFVRFVDVLSAALDNQQNQIVDRLGRMDPALLTLYGNMLATPGSYLNALNYYFRAYAANPNNELVVLSISLAYFQYALKRQCENRHYHILQGTSFFGKYKEMRLKPASTFEERQDEHERNILQEIDFNEGKMWHMLGLTHMALPSYKRCIEKGYTETGTDNLATRTNPALQSLKGSPNARSLDLGFHKEAGFALQCISAINGDPNVARKLAATLWVL